MKIFKYQLEKTDNQFIGMPQGAEILCIQVQNEKPCIWALCDPDKPISQRLFVTFGTNGYLPETIYRKYIGTYQLIGGKLVFHVFEVLQ